MNKRTRVIVVIGVILITLYTLYIILLVTQQKHFYQANIARDTAQLSTLLELIPTETYSQYRKRIKSFTSSKKEIIKAFAGRDRAKLLSLTEPLYKILKTENRFFSNIAFITPDNKAFLRMIKSDHVGEDIALLSQMIPLSNANQEPMAGFELTMQGLGFRLTQPIFYNGIYQGLLVFAIDGNQLASALQRHGLNDIAIYFPETNPDIDFRSTIAKHSIGTKAIFTDSPLLANLPATTDLSLNNQRLAINGKEILLLSDFQIENFNHEPIAHLMVAKDISSSQHAFRRTIINTIIIGLILMGLAVMVIYLGFDSLLREIILLNESLEGKVEDRTTKLRQESYKRQQAQEEWEKTFNAIKDIITIQDDSFHILRANKAAEKFSGIKQEELIGKRCFDLFNEGKPCEDCPHMRSKKTKVSHRTEIKLPGTETILLIEATPILNKDDSFFGIVHTAKDITKEKVAAERLQRAEKMEALGLMAGGVAHDLNNILSGVINYPELLLLKLEKDSPFRKTVQAIRASGLRAAAVVTDMLTITRGASTVKEPCNLNIIIADFIASAECEHLLGMYKKVELKTDLSDELKFINCSAIYIQKIIMNLLSNGLEACPEGGKVLISTTNILINSSSELQQPDRPGEYVKMIVSDSGQGIDPIDFHHIFEPFYTKKQMSRHSGTGLGLTVVWNSVQDHSGTIFVDSSKQGTIFTLFFPVVEGKDKQTSKIASDSSLSIPEGNGQSVLIIDDEQQQRDIASQILTILNYQCHAVASGEEAVAYMVDHNADLLLLDMIMGKDMNGRQTYEEIIKNHPGQKAIIASGFSDNQEVKRAMALGVGGFVMKPYTTQQLAVLVHQELHESS